MTTNQSEFNLYPNITITRKIVKVRFAVMEYIPFTQARIMCILYDEDDRAIDNRAFMLEKEDFLNWGSDDKYLVNWIKTKLTT